MKNRRWVIAFSGVLAALCAATLVVVPDHAILRTHFPGIFLVLLAAYGLAEVLVADISTKKGHHSFSANELPLVLGLLFASPRTLLGALSIALTSVLILHRRQTDVRLLFNVVQACLSASCATFIVHGLVGSTEATPSFRLWIIILIAAVGHSVVGAVSVNTAMAIVEGRGRFVMLPQVLTYSIVNGVTVACVGVLVGWAFTVDPTAGVLGAAPLLITFAAFRLFVEERQRRSDAEFLYGAVTGLRSKRSLDDGVAGLLDSLRTTLQSSNAEMYLTNAETGGWHKMTRSDAGGDDNFGPCSRDDVPRRRSFALPAKRGNRKTDPIVWDFGGESGAVGTLVISDKHTRNGVFTLSEWLLAGRLADQLAVHLDNSHLSASLARLEAAEEELRFRARHDPLTGLGNRTLLHELDDAEPPAALALIDLDGFKGVNDTLGHDAGDTVLRLVADRLRSVLPDGWTPVRLGGDEFAVFANVGHVPSVDELAHVEAALGDDLVRAIGVELGTPLGSSVGMTLRQEGDASVEDLLRRSDATMYSNKRTRSRDRRIAAEEASRVGGPKKPTIVDPRERERLVQDLEARMLAVGS